MQELPGITPQTLILADRLVEREFKVVMPHLFGPIGKKRVLANSIRVLCMRKEFHIWASGKSSPIVDWLSALCLKLREDHQVPGIAAIGMCLTGDFAISLMANEAVLASYSSQPSLPLFSKNKLPFSEAEVKAIRERLDTHGPMKCARFEHDPTCKAGKFEAIRAAFNDGDHERIQMDTLDDGGEKLHAILTLHYDHTPGHPTRKKLDEVVDYFDQALTI